VARYDWSRHGYIHFTRSGYIVHHSPTPPFTEPQVRQDRWWRFGRDVYSGVAMESLGLSLVPEKMPEEIHPEPPMPEADAEQLCLI
jgi:hypothetical protein